VVIQATCRNLVDLLKQNVYFPNGVTLQDDYKMAIHCSLKGCMMSIITSGGARYRSFVSFKDFEDLSDGGADDFYDNVHTDDSGHTCISSDPAYFENLANVSYYFYISGMCVAMVGALGFMVTQYKDPDDFGEKLKDIFTGTAISACATMGICSLFAASVMLGTFELTKSCTLWEMTGVDPLSSEPTSLIGYGKAGR